MFPDHAEKTKKEFGREASLLSLLHHPNILACYGASTDLKDLFIVTELMVVRSSCPPTTRPWPWAFGFLPPSPWASWPWSATSCCWFLISCGFEGILVGSPKRRVYKNQWSIKIRNGSCYRSRNAIFTSIFVSPQRPQVSKHPCRKKFWYVPAQPPSPPHVAAVWFSNQICPFLPSTSASFSRFCTPARSWYPHPLWWKITRFFCFNDWFVVI